jgi:hypothetical protein
MEALSHACCSWVEGGATTMEGKEIWDVSIFRHLLRWYLAFQVSGAEQEMIVEAASSTIMRTLVETQDLLSADVNMRLHRVLLEGGGSKLGFGDENSKIDYGWNHQHWHKCGISFFKA